MDTLTSILKLVTKGSRMVFVDLKQAYYSCPIAKSQQKLLKFNWKGQLYKFVCFPNGLACCPRKFTKLLKPVFSSLRKMGYVTAGYIDDTFLQGESYTECFQNVVDSVDLFQKLGFVIHPDKSVFKPTQTLTFLGFIIDSVNMTVKLTAEKAEKIKQFCIKILNSKKLRLDNLLNIGNMTASFPGVMYGPLYYRQIET